MFLWVSGNDFFIIIIAFGVFFFSALNGKRTTFKKKELLPLAPVHIVNWYCFCLINFFNLEKRFNFFTLAPIDTAEVCTCLIELFNLKKIIDFLTHKCDCTCTYKYIEIVCF